MKPLVITVLFICLESSLGKTYCPPLKAPVGTVLICVASEKNEEPKQRFIDCVSSWLPDGTIASYKCQLGGQSREGKIVCNGYYKKINNQTVVPLLSQIKEEDGHNKSSLPCGIEPMSGKGEFHFYGYKQAPHYPILQVNDNEDDEQKVTTDDDETIPGDEDEDFRVVGIKLVNMFRELHGSPPLQSDQLLTEKAQAWALSLAARGTLELAQESYIGQNVFNSDQTSELLAVNDAVQFWYKEGLSAYDWDNVKSVWDEPLGLDFSQLVWRSTKKIGFGAASKNLTEGTIVVAFFYPMGNIVIEDRDHPDKLFLENVLKPSQTTSE